MTFSLLRRLAEAAEQPYDRVVEQFGYHFVAVSAREQGYEAMLRCLGSSLPDALQCAASLPAWRCASPAGWAG